MNTASTIARTQVRDPAAAEIAAEALLAGLGVDTSGESMARTPRRMVQALAEMLTPAPFDLTTFPNDGGYRWRGSGAPARSRRRSRWRAPIPSAANAHATTGDGRSPAMSNLATTAGVQILRPPAAAKAQGAEPNALRA